MTVALAYMQLGQQLQLVVDVQLAQEERSAHQRQLEGEVVLQVCGQQLVGEVRCCYDFLGFLRGGVDFKHGLGLDWPGWGRALLLGRSLHQE